ncbi:hypothetical protein FACS189451_01180 [Bacteroidia bacterium]|nr:hypothetical protein FACS189446_8580 [Bacteroidia bacterium]GHT60682.1 hypothetical protein FACS189451_01180 [Bacteroidia bacterium]
MRSEALKNFIHKHAVLFWYSPEDKAETVSDELLVETILNYGDMEAVRELFKMIGTEQAATIFRGMTGRKQLNYFPEIWNFFNLYFNHYAP